MIIRCPECSTGFELPDDRVTAEGTKLKCSKCEHIFRVRDSDGEPEIFYKDRDRAKNNQGNNQSAGLADAGGSDDPFPHAGMDLKPKNKSAFGDLGADQEEMESFQSAFDERDEQDEVGQQATEDDDGPADFVEQTRPPGADDSGGQPAMAAAGAAQQEEPALDTGSSSDFGDPQDHVDPSFGEGGAYFDPEEGKVEEPNSSAPAGGSQAASPAGPGAANAPSPAAQSAGPPTAASGAPPNTGAPPQAAGPGGPAAQNSAPPNGQSGPATAAESASPATSTTGGVDSWDDEELAPHKIGGGTGKKVVTFLLLLSLVFIGFVGTVAYLNDGFIDFHAADEMLEVAFGDGEYEPREEWTAGGPATTVVEASQPVEVEGVHSERISLRGGDELFVVQGLVRNHDDEAFHNIDLRAMLMDTNHREMRTIQNRIGGTDIGFAEFRNLGSAGEADELVSDEAVVLQPGDVQRFTLVFDNLPQRVSDGEPFSLKVEVADKEAR